MEIDPTRTKWLRAKADKIGIDVTEQSKERNNEKAVPKACLLKADYGKDSSSGWTRLLEQIFTTREISS